MTATVTSGSGTPTGSVQFRDGGNPLGASIALVGGTASLASSAVNVGTHTITAVYMPTGNFTSSTSPGLTQTVNPATGTTSVAVSAFMVQYSDMETFTATFTPTNAGGPVPTRMSFKVGTQTIGDAPVNLVGSVYQAVWSGQMVEPMPFGAAPTGQMKPGSHTVYATTADSNFAPSTGSRPISIIREDARVANAGLTSVSFGGSATGTVVLSATVKDITAVIGDPAWDPYPGDIRNATVTFIDRATSTNIATVNVTLSGSDPKLGVVTYNWPVNLGTATSKSFTIGLIVSNYYNRSSTSDDATINVSK
jgi:hypothetical protein